MMNKRRLTILAALCALIPQTLQAQTEESLDAEFGLRLSATADKKVTRGLHVSLSEEVRLDNNFTGFDRLQTTLGASYKIHPNIKLGAGYAFIAPYSSSSSSFKSTRHRLMLDATGTLHLAQWNIGLKERLQFTHRAGSFNTYQSATNAVELKSRLLAKYKGWRQTGWTPYAYVELRTTFSGPTVNADCNAEGTEWYLPGTHTQEGEAGWFLEGFNGTYINRLRASIGADYRLSQSGTLTFFLLLDRVSSRALDANKEGTKLKSYTHRTGFVGTLGANYTYSF